MDILDIFYQ